MASLTGPRSTRASRQRSQPKRTASSPSETDMCVGRSGCACGDPTRPAYFAGAAGFVAGAALPAAAFGAFACIALRIAGVMSSAGVE